MKKLFCVMLALVMACAMLAVTAEDAADYLGDWYLVEMKMGDTGMNPSDLGMNMTMTVNEDGTVTEMETSFTDGVLVGTHEGEEVIVELNDNGTLSITNALDDETVMILYFEAV